MSVASRASILLLSQLLLVGALAAQVTPQDSEFLVNGLISGSQVSPDVAADALGNFVVVWSSTSPSGDGDGTSVRGQRFRFDGFPATPGFQVNTYTTGNQSEPSVAMDPVGGFVVVWASGGNPGPDGDGSSIQGQRYAFDGSPLGGEFQVNIFTSGDQVSPSVGMNDDGTFVVVWSSVVVVGPSTFSSVRSRSFAPQGMPISLEKNLGTGTYPGVAASASRFVVVWGAAYQYASAQVLTLDGTPLTGLFAVNDTKPGVSPAVASNPSDSFVVVWASTKPGASGILGRRINSDGSFGSGEIRLDTLGTGSEPDVASDAAGNFVAVWHDESDGSGVGVRIRGVSLAGVPVGDELQVNTYTTGNQWFPTVASGDDGEVAVAWMGQDADGLGIKGRRFQLEVPPPLSALIFADGFESGDVTAWSASVP